MKWKRGETFTSDMGEREESIAALSRSRRSKAASILRVNSVKIVPVSREQRISLTTRVATLADEENWEMLVSHCRSSMLVHRDHKRSLYKFHPLYEKVLCHGGDLAGTLECSSTKTGPRDPRFIGKREYLGTHGLARIIKSTRVIFFPDPPYLTSPL